MGVPIQVRAYMKDPLSARFVLPRTRVREIAEDGHRTTRSQPHGRFRGVRETKHAMTAECQEFDQGGADESVTPGHERGGCRTGRHGPSLSYPSRESQPQSPHTTRTAPVRWSRRAHEHRPGNTFAELDEMDRMRVPVFMGA